MKVLHVIEQLGIGGAEKDFIAKSLSLAQKDISILVFCFFKKGILASELEKNNIQILSMENRCKPFSIIRGALSLPKIIAKYNPDIVHSHMYSGEALISFFKSFYSSRTICISSVQSLHAQMRRSSTPIRKILDLFAIRYYQKFIVCSKAVKNELVHKGYPENSIEIIYNGVDFSKSIAPQNKYVPGEEPIIGVISRLSDYKGVDYFIKAIPLVLPKYPASKFWIVGDGEEKLNLIKLTNTLKISHVVQFLGVQKCIHDYLSRFCMLVVPSLCEPLGITAIEGLAMKLPVIASAVDGLKEIIFDNQTGYLVKPARPDEIAQKIIWILDNYYEAQHIANTGYAFAKETFSLPIVSEHQLATYQSLLGGSK